MTKLYFFVGAVFIVFMYVMCGTVIGNYRCRAHIAQENIDSLKTNQQQLLKEKRIIYETVYKTAADDVRRILHDKYTIAE